MPIASDRPLDAAEPSFVAMADPVFPLGLLVPTSTHFGEDTALLVTGITVNDPDPSGRTLTLTLSIGSGSLLITGGSGVTVGGTAQALTLTGTAADINAFIAAEGVRYTPPADFNGSLQLAVRVDDDGSPGGEPRSEERSFPLEIAAMSDPTELGGLDSMSVNEDTELRISGLWITDPDALDQEVTLTFAVDNGTLGGMTNGGVTVSGEGRSVSLTGTVTAINDYLGTSQLGYVPDADFAGAAALTLTYVDSHGDSLEKDVALNVTAQNDAPRITGPGGFSTDEDTAVALTGLDVVDVDGGPGDYSVTFSTGSSTAGAFTATSGAGVSVDGSGTSQLTLTGTLEDINVFLDDTPVVFTPAADYNGSVTFSIDADDGDAASTFGYEPTLTINAVDDAPTVTALSSISSLEDQPIALWGVVLSDVDSDQDVAELTLAAASGSWTLAEGAAGREFTATDSGNELKLTGRLQVLQQLVNDGLVVYHPVPNNSGDVNLHVAVGVPGQAASSAVDMTLQITSVEDAPAVSAPDDIDVVDGTATALSGISFSDVDGGGATVTVTLILTPAEGGALSATSAGGVAVGGTAQNLTLNGSLADLNAFIAANNVVFAPTAGTSADVSLQIHVRDDVNFTESSVDVVLRAVETNDAPVISGPLSIEFTEDTAGVIRGIVFSDTDAGTSEVTVTFLADGTFDPENSTGVTVATVSGGITLTGSLGDINDYIDQSKLGYTPPADRTEAVTLTVKIDDNGNTGVGGAKTATGTVLLQISAVNDAPDISVPTTIEVTEDVATALTGIGFSDVDAGSSPVTVTLSVPSGTLSATSAAGVIVSGTATALTLFGGLNDVQQLLDGGGVKYTTAANATADVTLTVAVDDNGNSGSGGAQGQVTTVTLQVTPVDDLPTISAPASMAVTEDVAAALTGVTFADVEGNGEIHAVFEVSSGTLSTASADGVTVGGSGREWVLIGSVSDVNAFIAAGKLVYQTDADATDSVTLDISVNHTGTGAATTGSSVVNVAPANDAPLVQLPDATSIPLNGSVVFSTANGNALSLADVDAGSGELTMTLTASNGLLTVTSHEGLTLLAGAWTDSASLQVSGTLTALNAALQGLVFTAEVGFIGLAGLTVDLTDNGHTGGEAESVSSELAIDVLADTTAPTFTGGTPADNATGVDVGASLSLTFSEEITAGDGQIVLWDVTNDQMVEVFQVGGRLREIGIAAALEAADGEVAISGNTLQVNPTDPLAAGTTYALHISAGAIRDLAGNGFAGFEDDTTYNFTTQRAAQPPTPGGGGANPTEPLIRGTAEGDVLQGSARNERFEAGDGRDTIVLGGGKDIADGGDGIDTAVFAGDRADWTVERTGDGSFVVTNAAGDRADLQGFERLQFDDETLAMDLTPAQAQIARLYAAALDRAPDEAGLEFYVDAMADGWSLARLARAFVNSPEYQTEYAGTSDTEFLTLLYDNAFGREPDAAGLAYQLDVLAHQPGLEGRANMLAAFIASPETQVQLAGQAEQGIVLYAA